MSLECPHGDSVTIYSVSVCDGINVEVTWELVPSFNHVCPGN